MVRSGSVRRTAASSSPAAAAVPTAFTASPGDYRLLEEVGYGANAVVYRAVFLPSNRTVAVKCLDLDRVNSNLVSFLSPSLSLSIETPSLVRVLGIPVVIAVLIGGYAVVQGRIRCS
jgi:serine/threonine protein kinase